jgi:branched-chain amino acid transport system substrate-binding protein
MNLTRRAVVAGSALAASAPRALRAQPAETIRIGVLDDQSGPYRDLTGSTGTACARQAVKEFTDANPSLKVEMLVGDHQQKPDIAASVARSWIDRDGVDVIVGVGSSAVALACNTVINEKDKVHLNTGAASSALTGASCSPNLVHWTMDTWCGAHTIAAPLVKAGGDTWFFITADYTFGHTFQKDATGFITAAGGKVIGSTTFPFPGTTDFASYLLEAQSSGAKVICFANAGSDFLNSFKQAKEFGLSRNGTVLVGLAFITDVLAMGLPAAQGLTLYETFYWDLNDRTRAFTARVRPNLPAGIFPNMDNAGNYGSITHYLKVAKEIGFTRAKASGRGMVEAMKAMPTDDDAFGKGSIRADGRKIHPSYLFRVKSPDQSKTIGDVFTVIATVPAEEAFRPLADGHCAFVKS